MIRGEMFEFYRKGRIHYLGSRSFEECGFLTHAFLTRGEGVSQGKFSSLNFSAREGDSKENVERNWEITAAAFHFRVSRFFMIQQVHGDRVVVAEETGSGLGDSPLQCDAVLTAVRGTAIGIKTADCVPVLLVDPVRKVIGAVHAGWRGTALKIVARTIGVMEQRFSCRPEDILAAIGPSIGPCCYQVDDLVFSFPAGDSGWKQAFQACAEGGKWMLDLPLANRLQLLEAGIPLQNIASSGLCTACRKDLFFSHRAEKGVTGRQLNFIILK